MRILAAVKATRDVPGGIRHDLEIVASSGSYARHVEADSERIPGILLLPRKSPAPAALLLHGLGSRKERMADTVGTALLTRGVASLAVDLPLHGARERDGVDLRRVNPLRLVGIWRDAVREAGAAISYLSAHADIDRRRLGIVGYSLGSFLANIVASDTPTVRAVVLAAGGDLPAGLPFESMIRGVMNPLRAVRAIAGRPLLMINGRYDTTVTPAQAERLFAAASEPRVLRWYNGGHWPPTREIDAAAAWLAEQLVTPAASRTSRTRASSGG